MPIANGIRAGVYLANYGDYADPNFVLKAARAAREGGWDGFFLFDHLTLGARPTLDPWTMLAAVAHALDGCEGFQIGVLLAVPARRHLGVLAQQTATIQRLLRTPLVVGLGIGVVEDFRAFGVDMSEAERAAHVELAMEVLPSFWAGETISETVDTTAGSKRQAEASLKFENARTGPALTIRPEIWIGTGHLNDAGARRAARADGVFPIRLPWRHKHLLDNSELGEFTAKLEKHLVGSPAPSIATAGISDPGDAEAHALDFPDLSWWLEVMGPEFRPTDHVLTRIRNGP